MMQTEHLDHTLTYYQEILDKWDEKNKNENTDFNIFHLIDHIYGISEIRHSKFIAFLLNPHANHAQGSAFLKLFLQTLYPNEYANDLFDDKKDWEVLAESNNIDILIRNKTHHFSIIIENKSNWAECQPNQLYRYWYQEIFPKIDKLDYVNHPLRDLDAIIYLSPNENKVYSEHSLCKHENCDCSMEKLEDKHITKIYFNKEFKQWLEDCLKHTLPQKTRNYIEDYLNFWNDTQLKHETIMEELLNYFTADKKKEWENLLEVSSKIEDLKNRWVDNFENKLKNIDYNKEWNFKKINDNDFRWFLDDENKIGFTYEYEKGFSLWTNVGDSKIIKNELEKFLEKIGSITNENEKHYIAFFDNNNTRFCNDNDFYWTAGNKPENIINYLQPALNELTNNPLFTNKIKELNREI